MKKSAIFLIVAMMLGLSAAVSADVTIKREVSFQMMGMPASQLSSTEQIQGEKSRSTTEFTGGPMMDMAGGQQSAEINITRLDKGVLWNVHEGKKTYNEIELAGFKEMMERSGMSSPDKETPEKYEWTYEQEKADKTTDKGYECTAVIATATGVNKEDPSDKVKLHYEFWFSDDIPGHDDLQAYNKNYTDVIGIDPVKQNQQVTKMIGEFGPQFEKMAENFEGMDGYPVKTVIWSKKTGEMSVPGMPEGEKMDPRAKEMMKKMMGGGEEESADGMQTVFKVSTEIVDVDTDGIDSEVFDIPEGYEKK